LKIMNIDYDQANTLLIIALMMGTPFFVVFGWLSDKIGRKPIMLLGMLLGVICYRPIYEKMYQTANLGNKEEVTANLKVEVKRALLTNLATDSLITTITTHAYTDGTIFKETVKETISPSKESKPEMSQSIKVNEKDKWTLIWLIFIQLIFVTMAYGPIAAFLVELFPVKIRYTSMSLPYHIGNGVFGGLMPAIATYLVTASKDANNPDFYLAGLTYPIVIAGVCFVIGLVYIRDLGVKGNRD
jgi:MFS family permease